MTSTPYGASSASFGGSSYAAGSLTPAAPEPRKLQWSMYVVGAGCVAMFVGLVLAISGTPGKLAYNVNAPGERNRNTSNDPMKTMRSMDANIKWVAENTKGAPGQFNFYLSNIDTSENQIAPMAAAVASLTASVIAIDDNLSQVAKTTTQMNTDMQTMATTSAESAATMASINTSITSLSGSLSQLATATSTLVTAMSAIEQKALGIATKGTNVALQKTTSLNSVLPASVPKGVTSLNPGASPQGAL